MWFENAIGKENIKFMFNNEFNIKILKLIISHWAFFRFKDWVLL